MKDAARRGRKHTSQNEIGKIVDVDKRYQMLAVPTNKHHAFDTLCLRKKWPYCIIRPAIRPIDPRHSNQASSWRNLAGNCTFRTYDAPLLPQAPPL